MAISGIYQITNQVNGKRYIGSSVCIETRWRVHLTALRDGTHHSLYLQRVFNKYGEEAFAFEILEKIKKEQCIQREQHYFDTLSPEYNISPTAGSTLGIRLPLETRRKLSAAHKGLQVSEETKRRLSEVNKGEQHPMYGKQPSEETRRKISEALKGKPHPHRGHRHSSETRRKMSAAKSGEQHPMHGKHHSAESKRKNREAHIGRHPSEEARRNMSIAQKLRQLALRSARLDHELL